MAPIFMQGDNYPQLMFLGVPTKSPIQMHDPLATRYFFK